MVSLSNPSRSVRRSHIFLYFCICFIGGVVIRSVVEMPLIMAFGFVLIVGIVAASFWTSKKIRWLSLGAIFVFFGFWRMDTSVVKDITAQHIQYYNGQEVLLQGTVVDVDKRLDQTKITLDNIVIEPVNTWQKQDLSLFHDRELMTGQTSILGKTLVNISQFKTFRYADRVRVRCLLETPGVFDGFDYGAYLAVSDIYSVCYRPERIENIAGPQMRWTQKIQSVFLDYRGRFSAIIDQSTPYPASALLKAVVFGLRREIPPAMYDEFNRTGISHIIAVSGSHITIITSILWLWLLGFGLPRKWAFWCTIIGIILLIGVIGFIPSAVRAAVMGTLVIIARYFGRSRHSVNLLMLAAVVLLLINPKLARYDLGFQLSFLAVLGLIYVEPYMMKALMRAHIPELGFMQVRSSLAMTLAAQVFVTPWVVFSFDRLSLIAPLANLIVLPVSTAILLGGLLLSLIGLVWVPLAQFIGWWMTWLLQFVIWANHQMAMWKWSSLTIEQLPFWIVIIMYILLGAGVWYLRRRERMKRLREMFKPEEELKKEEVETITINFH